MSQNYEKIKKMRQNRERRTRLKIKRFTLRPRLVVFRSSKHIYAQIVDDSNGNTIASASTLVKEFQELQPSLRGIDAAKWVGKLIAKKAIATGIHKVVFDRGRFLYHGRVKALAESARETGLDF